MQKAISYFASALQDNKFSIGFEDGVLSIKSSSWNPSFLVALAPVVGAGLFFLGGDFKIILLSVLVILFPVVYDGWKFPKKIEFNTYSKTITLYKNVLMKSSLEYSEVTDLYGEKNELWSDVSAFQEGNRDFVYKLYMKSASGKTYQLIRLQFREEKDQFVNELAKFFKTLKATK